jgi:hypothetical protein
LLGPDLRISGPQATSSEYAPAVAWNDSEGEYLVVWQDHRNLAVGGPDIYARRVAADGARLGGDIRISPPDATAGEYAPSVAWNDSAGEYLVVWEDTRGPSSRGTDIYGQRVGADGTRQGDGFLISGTRAVADEARPQVVWNGAAGEYLVAWTDYRNPLAPGGEVFGRRLDAGGAPIDSDFRISGRDASVRNDFVAVAADDTAGGYLVVWADDRGADIYGRRVGADGAPTGPDIRISSIKVTETADDPAVAWNATAGEYLVVWADQREPLTRARDIYGRRVAADGTRLGGGFRISGLKAVKDEGAPAVVWNTAANEYLVVRHDFRNITLHRGADPYGRRVGPDGVPIGSDFRISGLNAVRDEYYPEVACDQDSGQCLVVWEDSRNFETGRLVDIYGRRVNG